MNPTSKEPKMKTKKLIQLLSLIACFIILSPRLSQAWFDVTHLAVAKVAGIMAAKKTPDLIPLCHPILIDNVAIEFDLSGGNSIGITTRVKSTGKTGAEMEALVAASVTALTIYDMAKAVDRAMTIADTYLESKKGGKSGVYRRKEG